MKNSSLLLAMWLVNGTLILLANWFMPETYVLGTYRMGVFVSALVASLVWTIITLLVEPVLKVANYKPKNPVVSMLIYLVANFVGLWLVARMAPLTGFGVMSWVWVLALAFVGNLVQFVTWSALDKTKFK